MMQRGARTCQTRVTRGAKLGGRLCGWIFIIIIYTKRIFFPANFSETFNYFFFRSGRWLRESVGVWVEIGRAAVAGGGLFQGTREKRV